MKYILGALFFSVAAIAVPDVPTESISAVLSSSSSMSRNILLIDPKARSQDYIQAFEALRHDKPSLKINVQTLGGIIANVGEMRASDEGTLLFLKVPSNQGMRLQIVALEDIKEILYSP